MHQLLLLLREEPLVPNKQEAELALGGIDMSVKREIPVPARK
jgi:hypothetical protein